MDLTRRQADRAAVALAGLRAKEHAAMETLTMLETCRQDYRSRLDQKGRDGIDHKDWINYQEFLHKLDHAIAQQTGVISQCRLQTQAGLEQWQASRIRLKSFEILLQRHEREDRLRETRIEQRNQDEKGAQVHLRKLTENES